MWITEAAFGVVDDLGDSRTREPRESRQIARFARALPLNSFEQNQCQAVGHHDNIHGNEHMSLSLMNGSLSAPVPSRSKDGRSSPYYRSGAPACVDERQYETHRK